MQFKEKNLSLEFYRAEPAVIALALYFDWYSLNFFGREAVVTDVDRTQEDYDRIYANEILKGNFWVDAAGKKHYAGPTPHLFDGERHLKSRAVDFRSTIYTALEIGRVRDHFNATWQRPDGKPTLLYHNVGQGAHIHLQAYITHREE